MNKLPTIKLKGREYVQVKDRVLFFNEEYPNGSISTDVEHKQDGSYAWFKAVVTPDVSNPARVFIGRSSGPVDEEKSYEKLETVAIGRSLALMGIGVLEGIASADEMQKYETGKVKKVPYSNVKPKKIVDHVDLKPCDRCGGKFALREGKYGPFYSCSNYPKCKRVLKVEDAAMWVNVSPPTFDDAPVPSEY